MRHLCAVCKKPVLASKGKIYELVTTNDHLIYAYVHLTRCNAKLKKNVKVNDGS